MAKMIKIIPFISSSFSSNVYLLKAKKINLEDLNLIILTHNHPDHTLALPFLLKETRARVAIHKDELTSNIKSIMGFPIPEIKPDFILNGGEKLNLGDFSLDVIHTPGHTSGSICLYQDGILFSGDTIFAGGNIGRTDLGGDNKDLLSSIKKLTDLNVEMVYPGHGEIITRNAREEILSSFQLAKDNQ